MLLGNKFGEKLWMFLGNKLGDKRLMFLGNQLEDKYECSKETSAMFISNTMTVGSQQGYNRITSLTDVTLSAPLLAFHSTRSDALMPRCRPGL